MPEPGKGEGGGPTLRDVQVDLSGAEERIRTIERARTDLVATLEEVAAAYAASPRGAAGVEATVRTLLPG